MSILTKDQVKGVIELYNIKTAQDTVKNLMKDAMQNTLGLVIER